MGFSTDYLYCFHYSGSTGYLIFCCHSVATKKWSSTPRCVNKLPLIERFSAALHNVNNLFMRRTQINVTLVNVNFCFLELNN